MKSRLDLHDELTTLLGSSHAYFQPPESVKMIYPCFVYSRNIDHTARANNRLYSYRHAYHLTYITDDSETNMPYLVLMTFPMSSQGRPFVSDNLYHFPFDIYY